MHAANARFPPIADISSLARYFDGMILIRRRPDGIVGVATPPHVKETWVFTAALSADDFSDEMRQRGSHPVDTLDVRTEAERSGFGYLP
jgi:hypothetical protein